MRKIAILMILVLLVACDDDVLPKPNAYLRLDYPVPVYQEQVIDLPFSFERNVLADSISSVKTARDGSSKGIDLVYPSLKGTIYLTYKEVNETNLELFLLDAQNLTQKHTLKADEIIEQPYINEKNKVYGMFYEVGGNAASQSQFYATDSTNHFLSGSLYFYAKPNYDSIYPAAIYLRNDIKRVMESLEWKK